MIEDFQIALDRQNPTEIETLREQFSHWLDSIDHSFFS